MTRLEKCQYLKEKGYTYKPQTGQIFGVRGKEITRKDKNGYSWLWITNSFNLFGHHFAWYMTYGNVDFWELDHKDIDPTNNRIDNLRIITRSQQLENRNSKGCSFHKRMGKWRAYIKVNKKEKHLGYFNTEEEARQAYLQAKEKYHIID